MKTKSSPRYINPFTDYGFKLLFGTERNKDLLIDFLNALLREEEGLITDITYLNKEQKGKNKESRTSVYDIYCENQRGERFIVEIQKAKQDHFKDRMVYYSTFPIQEQAKKGDWNYELKAIYSIAILDFRLPQSDPLDRDIISEGKLYDLRKGKIMYDKLTFIYLEMPKFGKEWHECSNHFEKWLYLFKNLNQLQEMPVGLVERQFKKFLKEAQIANLSKEEYTMYEESLKRYNDLKNSLDTAKEEGREEGREEGKKAREIEIAKKAKAEGIPLETIMLLTGLSKEVIDKL
ncbi:Rpn family recombination-promoting nuclease/putative transposase [Algivirga pacifica]|uniref:Rpn family recombination-promoting nuclease/putative transposase n=1 Tax=Algivirga pacifica TaxID=1162670 RepID=A0ABP9D3Y8_9BACT